MRRYHITLGAYTTAGGNVVSASSAGIINGQPIALEGDMIACRSCKSHGYIVCDGPRHVETWAGKQVALENDFCVCKCSPPPRLIANQSLRYQTIENADASAVNTLVSPAVAVSAVITAASNATSAPSSSTAPITSAHSQLYVLADRDGCVLKNRPYRIWLNDDTVIEGISDRNGATDLLNNDTPFISEIHILKRNC